MTTIQVCRICLAHGTCLYTIANVPLQKFYEKITNKSLKAEDDSPTVAPLVCYICYHLLKKCHRFSESAIKADEVVQQIYSSKIQITEKNISMTQKQFLFMDFKNSPVTFVNVAGDMSKHFEKPKVKNEETLDVDGVNDEQGLAVNTRGTHEDINIATNFKIKKETVDMNGTEDYGLRAKDIPYSQSLHHSSDIEDEIDLENIKLEVDNDATYKESFPEQSKQRNKGPPGSKKRKLDQTTKSSETLVQVHEADVNAVNATNDITQIKDYPRLRKRKLKQTTETPEQLEAQSLATEDDSIAENSTKHRKTTKEMSKIQQFPEVTVTCSGEEDVIYEFTPSGSHLRVWTPPTTPEVLTPSSSSRPKKSCRSLKLRDKIIFVNSGSELESEEDDEEEMVYNMQEERFRMRRFRHEEVLLRGDDGCEKREHDEECNIMNEEIVLGNGADEPLTVAQEHGECEDVDMGEERVIGDVVVESLEQPPVGQEYEDLDVFSWSEDFSSFSGQKETYLRSPGPTVGSQDPVQIFMEVWDERIMEKLVRATNRYAWQCFAPLTEFENGLPKYLTEWTDITVAELYRYFAMLIYMSICYRTRVKDYWTTGILEMPALRKVMTRTRYDLITRYLHFVDNNRNNPSYSSYEKKISKILPIIKHCNGKFGKLYIPSKHLSLDESLLLWKGRLSWVQCIRTKAARFGIKSFELCEATTGYQLRCLIYAGKASSMSSESIHGFKNCTAKVVLELMDGYLDVGHTLVMDNWYNQLSLTRFLKRRRTDVIGTMNRRRINIPDAIRSANEKRMPRGQQVARHCGDISLIAWKDVKLVTTMSTYHNDLQLPVQRAGERILKPISIIEYNKYMGGVDSKDQKLSMYPMERKRGQKWYMKVFKRLFNTSLLNTYIIYTKNPLPRPLTHREFRIEVARGLLERFSVSAKTPVNPAPLARELDKNARRLQKADHFPAHTDKVPGKKNHKQMRCVRCTAAGRRSMVTYMCTFCNVPLCIGLCWTEYHTLKTL